MTSPPTKSQLAEWKREAEKPLDDCKNCVGREETHNDICVTDEGVMLANLRWAVPLLVAEVERLQAEVTRLEEEIEQGEPYDWEWNP